MKGIRISESDDELLYSVRNQHLYIPGKPGYGKSTLLFWMALQDIKNGKGVAVLDPKGDLVELLLHHIPLERLNETIYLDGLTPIPVDFMSWETEIERELLMGDLAGTFKQVSQNTGGDRWPAILQWTLKALLEAKKCSFLDIYYFLVNEDKRAKILQRVQDEDTLHFWKIYPKAFPKDAANPITIRMSQFLSRSMKGILGSADAKLNISDVMESGKILLVNLQKCGKESGNLLGMLLTSKFQQAAMKRGNQKIWERKPFYFYADEFRNFQTSAFDVILSEARGFQLCLTLANQYLSQLEAHIRSAVIGTVSTVIVFRIGSDDLSLFQREIRIPQFRETADTQRKDFLRTRIQKFELQVTDLQEKLKHVSARNPAEAAELRNGIIKKGYQICDDREQLSNLEKASPTLPPQFEIESLLDLPVGKALYRAADGSFRLIDTPKPPKPPDNRQVQYAEYIKKRTIQEYGLPHPEKSVESNQDGNPSHSTAKPDEDPGPTLQSDKPKPRHT